ncbi:biopolymer transporter ExbD [Sunxiuqinia elliptica]|uniref:Biopolymer transport protein ExbD n=1 Tax=Sunxiuqinia elliptica TaxID=655355 RepID=A0A4R6H6W9_9BACT|nr:biopolymer transporter ExbD [Sunxiuqinia elliptica]TDO03311.1 biopolymer transport protein ExbD [Sunxiuqinia elliptica]TDO59508.1 biopolymer transport protein ExbD [Sunxiuqinia elliptica]
MAKKVPEIPGSSLADIAFMLLIFFLVTTTMDVDSGLERRLPPMPPEEQEDDDTPPIKERNVFVVLVNANNQLLVEGEITNIDNLRDKAKEFMANPYNEETLPEKQMKEVDFFGPVEVTKGVISLRNDVGTQYGTYIAVQNELVGAINDLREDLAKQKFGKSFTKLDRDQQNAIKDIYPSRISEAEPKKVGGN